MKYLHICILIHSLLYITLSYIYLDINITQKTFIYDWIAGANLSRRINPVNSEYIKNFIELNDFSYLSEKELSLLQQQIQISTNTGHKISKLMPYLAPHQHHQEIGLWATQKVVEYIFPFLGSNFK